MRTQIYQRNVSPAQVLLYCLAREPIHSASLPPPPPPSLLYVYTNVYTCDGPLWALLTLRCYLVASTHRARGFSIILKQPSRSVLIPPGFWRSPACIQCVYIGIAQGAQRGKLLLFPQHYARLAMSVFPSKSRRPGTGGGRPLSLAPPPSRFCLIVFAAADILRNTHNERNTRGTRSPQTSGSVQFRDAIAGAINPFIVGEAGRYS